MYVGKVIYQQKFACFGISGLFMKLQSMFVKIYSMQHTFISCAGRKYNIHIRIRNNSYINNTIRQNTKN